MLVGIDFGNKLSGTTVIAYSPDEKEVFFVKSKKGQDADEFIYEFITTNAPAEVFIDAPLSLPGVYHDIPDCNDYFFRKADKIASGMSPMFLGGLTARAIRLKNLVIDKSVNFFETFPGYLARDWGFNQYGYKKSGSHISGILEMIRDKVSFDIRNADTWHHIDALLALISHHRYHAGKAKIFGLPQEGLIIV
jgi:predicted nuclease with RNAse H fold